MALTIIFSIKNNMNKKHILQILFSVIICCLLYLIYRKFATPKTKIFLLYNNEDITRFNHPDIIPYKLNQTLYFESQAFDEIMHLPNVTNIGFITPSFFRKQKLSLEQVFEHCNKGLLQSTVFLLDSTSNRIEFATKYHGPAFKTIWTWLINELGYKKYSNDDFKGANSNMWVARREFVVKFLHEAKRAIFLCNNAPEHIKVLLFSDSRYDGQAKNQMMQKFGIPHYPFHPFILENLIAFYTYLDDIGKF
jgi:hypothetical protein